jgi:hypothetical protein
MKKNIVCIAIVALIVAWLSPVAAAPTSWATYNHSYGGLSIEYPTTTEIYPFDTDKKSIVFRYVEQGYQTQPGLEFKITVMESWPFGDDMETFIESSAIEYMWGMHTSRVYLRYIITERKKYSFLYQCRWVDNRVFDEPMRLMGRDWFLPWKVYIAYEALYPMSLESVYRPVVDRMVSSFSKSLYNYSD